MKISKLALVAVTAALAATTFAGPPRPRGGFHGRGPAPHGRFHGGPPPGFHHHHHHGSAAAAVVGAGIFGLVTGAILASEPAPQTTIVRETVYTPAPTVIQQPVVVQQPAVVQQPVIVQQPVVVQPATITVPPPVSAQPLVGPQGSTVIIRQP